MDDEYEESFERAVYSKVMKVNHLVNDVTIGPNSIRNINLKASPHTSSHKSPSKPLNKRKQVSSPVIEHGLPTNQFLKFLDLERQEKAQTALNERLNLFQQFSRAQEEQSKQSWLRTQQNFIKDMERQEMYMIEANQQYDLQQSTQHARLAQLTQNAIQRMKERQELLREKERQRQLLAECINKIKSNQQQFSAEFQEILEIIKSCPDKEALKSHDMEFRFLKKLQAAIEAIFLKCRVDNISNITEKEVQDCDEIVEQLIGLKYQFKDTVEIIRQKQEQAKIDATKQQEQEIRHKSVHVPQPIISQAPAVTTAPIEEAQKPILIDSVNKLSKYINVKDLQTYADLINFYEEYKKAFSQLENDQSLKTFKFDCKKAINIPVNALSGVNSEHIMDKYMKLNRLLLGQTVVVSDKQINAARHPQGIPFCTDLLARKFVLQGDLMVSSNPESAFCYASVIVSLWNDFPDFGRLLLAHFYKMCPYLVPYYIPREVGESNEDFYTKSGYQYKDGEVEKQDRFLKRMSGIMKLYFSIMIVKPKRGQNTHPYNLTHGWKWLASFVRLEPQLDITATALHVFLETVGFEMIARYRKMFHKLLVTIIQVFLPKCKAVKCTGGAVTRLELLLTNYVKTKTFDKPNGYLEYPYW